MIFITKKSGVIVPGGVVTKVATAPMLHTSSASGVLFGTTAETFNATGGANNCLVAVLSVIGDTNTTPIDHTLSGLTFGIQPMTRVVSTKNTAANRNPSVHIFQLMNPTAGAASFTWLTDQFVDATMISCIELTGVNSSTPTGQTASGDGVNSIAITPNNNDSWVVGFAAGRDDTPLPLTLTGDSTLINESHTGTSGFGDVTSLFVENDVGTAGALTLGTTTALTDPAIVAAEFRP